MGMAFTDTLVSETDAQVVIVDRQHRPGGHWNRAYPFVRLHQPSAFYGVGSRELSVLDQGNLPADPDTLYVDCSAGGLQPPPKVPVFDGKRINLLMVRTCQPAFSAALIPFVESQVKIQASRTPCARSYP